MKNYLSKTKIVALALATFFATSFTVPAIASDKENKKVEVSYVGNLNDSPVYRLALKNNVSETYYVSVTDNDGNVLYKEKVSGANIVRNYQFEDESLEGYEFTFTISDSKNKTIGEYTVNKSKKVVDEVTVNKIK